MRELFLLGLTPPPETKDPHTTLLLSFVSGTLVTATIIGAVLASRANTDGAKAAMAHLSARIRSWWVMAAIFSATVILGPIFTTVRFTLVSFLAMREFITLNRTERADHEILFWAFL